MEPVRVKVYGLFPMTRRRYLMQVAFAGLLAVALLSVWFLRWQVVRPHLIEADTPIMSAIITFWDAAPWVVLGLVFLQIFEAHFVLRAFARKEALQQKVLADIASREEGESSGR